MLTKTDERIVKLDWSRLLGFDQLREPGDEKATGRNTNDRLTKLGGVKFGLIKKGFTKSGFTKRGGRRPEIIVLTGER